MKKKIVIEPTINFGIDSIQPIEGCDCDQDIYIGEVTVTAASKKEVKAILKDLKVAFDLWAKTK